MVWNRNDYGDDIPNGVYIPLQKDTLGRWASFPDGCGICYGPRIRISSL